MNKSTLAYFLCCQSDALYLRLDSLISGYNQAAFSGLITYSQAITLSTRAHRILQRIHDRCQRRDLALELFIFEFQLKGDSSL
jgi:hypothetical protein